MWIYEKQLVDWQAHEDYWTHGLFIISFWTIKINDSSWIASSSKSIWISWVVRLWNKTSAGPLSAYFSSCYWTGTRSIKGTNETEFITPHLITLEFNLSKNVVSWIAITVNMSIFYWVLLCENTRLSKSVGNTSSLTSESLSFSWNKQIYEQV